MLTAGDEYPLHQTPEPIAYAGSDRNFYDRFFFNGYSPEGDIFFAVALGVYPHLNIMDGAVSILRDGVQKSLHVSRLLHMQRMDMTVGPLQITILEPLRRIGLKLDLTDGLGLELEFTGRHFPVEEPRFSYRQGPRMLIDCTRMTQNGHWKGTLELDGESIDVDGYHGTRDRSWGVRPIGARDEQPVLPLRLPQFYWVWAPVNFPNLSLYFHLNQDAEGQTWNKRSVLAMDGADHAGLQTLESPQLSLDWQAGSRRVASGRLAVTDAAGRSHEILYEPLATFMMKGIGYGHPDKGHGRYRGELSVEREDLVPSTLDWQQPENLHIQALVRAVHKGPGGQTSSGMGIMEQLFIGPHRPNGWRDLMDA